MYKNFIFDFGQVIVKFEPEYMTSAYVKNAEDVKLVKEVVFDRLYWDKLDMGTISDEEVKELIRSRVSDELKEISCKVYDNWINNLTPVQGMQKLIYDIHKKDKRMYLLSNISIGFGKNYHKVEWINELLSYFDGMVFSGEISKVKPSTEIFEYILSKYNLKREECIFIDDKRSNLRVAEELGIKCVWYQNYKDAKRVVSYKDIKYNKLLARLERFLV